MVDDKVWEERIDRLDKGPALQINHFAIFYQRLHETSDSNLDLHKEYTSTNSQSPSS